MEQKPPIRRPGMALFSYVPTRTKLITKMINVVDVGGSFELESLLTFLPVTKGS